MPLVHVTPFWSSRYGLWWSWLFWLAANSLVGLFSDKISVSGTQASTGLSLLAASEPTAGGYAGQIVFHVQDGSLATKSAVVEQAIGRLRGLPHVLSVLT